jgi:hypothetical protein
MIFLKRVLSFLVLLLGSIGFIGCLLGIYIVWQLGTRLERANDRVFTRIDHAMELTHDRVLRVQLRVQASMITIDELGQTLRDWLQKKKDERIRTRLEIEIRVEKVSQVLQQATSWLESSAESIRGAQQLLELGNSLGAPIDKALFEEILERLTLLGGNMEQVLETTKGIQEFLSQADAPELQKDIQIRATQLVVRILLTMSEIDIRLGESANRLWEMQRNAEQMKVQTRYSITLVTVGCLLLIVWMAMGQVLLGRYGWKKIVRSLRDRRIS